MRETLCIIERVTYAEFFSETTAPPPPPDRPRIKFNSWQALEGTPPPPKKQYEPPLLTHINPATKDKTLVKAANAKFISNALANELIALDSPLKRKYSTTLECRNTIVQKGKKFTSTYCNCKWCLQCNRIRTGRLINKYELLTDYLSDSQFVTLTIRNVNRYNYDSDQDFIEAIRYTQRHMYTTFRHIQDYFRKRNIPLKGVRAFENIPSLDDKGAHPHIHWQIDGTIERDEFIYMWRKCGFSEIQLHVLLMRLRKKKITLGHCKGQLIIQMWLTAMGERSERVGQNVKACTAGTAKELFKYQTKIFIKKDGVREVPIRMLDMIFRATHGVKAIVITGFLTKAPKADYLKIIDPVLRQIAFEKFAAKAAEHVLYQKLTKALCMDVNEELRAQDMELSQNLSVDIETGEIVETPEPETVIYTWKKNNWYSDDHQRVVDFKVSNKTRKLLASFNSS